MGCVLTIFTRMKKILFLIAALVIIPGLRAQSGFLAGQSRYPRVRAALEEKAETIDACLATHGLDRGRFHILITAYKVEGLLEIHAKDREESAYRKIAEYRICARSGSPGPKRRQGDRQVPEGFYYIDRFNPSSNYHLSLGISYPNGADRIRCDASDPGGDIFIHGSCVTIGCLPMTDDQIREIYLYAVYARDNGQTRIPVYIFPFRLEENNLDAYIRRYAPGEELTAFWENLRQGYTLWRDSGRELTFSVDRTGNYVFRP